MCCCCCGNTGIAGVTGIGNLPVNGIPATGPLQVTLTFDGIAQQPETLTTIGNFYAGVGVTFSIGDAVNHDFGGGHTTTAYVNPTLQFASTFNFFRIEFDWRSTASASIQLYQGATKIYDTGEGPGTNYLWEHLDWNVSALTSGLYTTANGFGMVLTQASTGSLDTVVMTYYP